MDKANSDLQWNQTRTKRPTHVYSTSRPGMEGVTLQHDFTCYSVTLHSSTCKTRLDTAQCKGDTSTVYHNHTQLTGHVYCLPPTIHSVTGHVYCLAPTIHSSWDTSTVYHQPYTAHRTRLLSTTNHTQLTSTVYCLPPTIHSSPDTSTVYHQPYTAHVYCLLSTTKPYTAHRTRLLSTTTYTAHGTQRALSIRQMEMCFNHQPLMAARFLCSTFLRCTKILVRTPEEAINPLHSRTLVATSGPEVQVTVLDQVLRFIRVA